MSLLKICRSLDFVAPKIRRQALAARDECIKAGYAVDFFETHRSLARQADLFAQGRTKPGKIVTNAEPGLSSHHYGLALDIAYYLNGRWDWSGDFDKPGAIFVAHGFEPPPKFEKVHFQMTNGLSGRALRDLARKMTVLDLWRELGLD